MTDGSTLGISASTRPGSRPRFRVGHRVLVASIVFGPIRVNRSTTCNASVDPWKFVAGDLSLKFVVSTTSVLPSHRPRASPYHWRTFSGQMRTAVQRNDADVVVRLRDDRHVAGTLEELRFRRDTGRRSPALRDCRPARAVSLRCRECTACRCCRASARRPPDLAAWRPRRGRPDAARASGVSEGSRPFEPDPR